MIITETQYRLTSLLLAKMFNLNENSLISLRVVSNDENPTELTSEVHLVPNVYQPVSSDSTLVISGGVQELYLMLSSQGLVPVETVTKFDLTNFLDWYLQDVASDFWPISPVNFSSGFDFWKVNVYYTDFKSSQVVTLPEAS